MQEQGVVSRMYPLNLFTYSSYWGNWSRVLRYMNNGNDGQIEVDLTAINITSPLNWPRVAAVNIRKHGTSRSPKDLYVAELPASALVHMNKWLDAETIETLLHEDILSNIDWDLYNKHRNGGCAYNLCKIKE